MGAALGRLRSKRRSRHGLAGDGGSRRLARPARRGPAECGARAGTAAPRFAELAAGPGYSARIRARGRRRIDGNAALRGAALAPMMRRPRGAGLRSKGPA